jgi:hypothetical protein
VTAPRQQRHGDVAARIDARCGEADDTDDRCDQVGHRRELAGSSRRVGLRARDHTVDPRHRCHARTATVVLVVLATNAGTAADHRQRKRDHRCDDHTHARGLAHRHRAVAQTGGDPTRCDERVRAAQQPAVPETDLAVPRRDPAEQQATDGPLQQHGGGIEADHADRLGRRAVAPPVRGVAGPRLPPTGTLPTCSPDVCSRSPSRCSS